MSDSSDRRLRRLAELVDRNRTVKDALENLADAEMAKQAIVHAANLAVFIMYGEPKIAEPVTAAWQRIRQKTDRLADPCNPFNKRWAFFMSIIVRQEIIPNLPGDSEKEKLDAIFASAPPWLIWFAHGDFTADVLGLKLPDLAPVRKFVRAQEFVDIWPALPRGAFECTPWPDGSLNEPFTDADREELRQGLGVWHDNMSKRERKSAIRTYASSPKKKRSISWPSLPEHWKA